MLTAGVRVSAHVPAVASNKQNNVIRLGMRRDMVAPIWEGITLLPDEITKAKTRRNCRHGSPTACGEDHPLGGLLQTAGPNPVGFRHGRNLVERSGRAAENRSLPRDPDSQRDRARDSGRFFKVFVVALLGLVRGPNGKYPVRPEFVLPLAEYVRQAVYHRAQAREIFTIITSSDGDPARRAALCPAWSRWDRTNHRPRRECSAGLA